VPDNPILFDRALLRIRRRRASLRGPQTFLLERVAEDLAERLSVVKRQFFRAADIGASGPAIADSLMRGRLAQTVICVPDDLASCGRGLPAIAADEEALPFADGSLDLAVSALSLHHVNDLPGVLVQIRRALKPDGLFLAALLGGDTLTELRHAFTQAEAEIEGGASPRVAPFADLRALGALLQRAGFALPVTDVDRVTVRYADAFALMNDLRGMGATNVMVARRKSPTRRSTMMRMAEIYAERFSDPDGRIRATFDIVWLSGWAPHASQQQPLKPGSAKMRLADALGTTERSAGQEPGPLAD
jgi:SAM-dependent methyltransferase